MRFVQKTAHVLPPMLDAKLVKIRRFMMGFPMGFERRSTRPGQTDRTNIMRTLPCVWAETVTASAIWLRIAAGACVCASIDCPMPSTRKCHMLHAIFAQIVTNAPEPCGSRTAAGAASFTAHTAAVGRMKSGQKVRFQKTSMRRTSKLPHAMVRMSVPTAPHVTTDCNDVATCSPYTAESKNDHNRKV